MIKGQFFYSHIEGDLLKIIISSSPINKKETIDGIEFSYFNDELVEIKFLEIKNIIKIKTEGKIFLPPNELIDVLNTLLGDKYKLDHAKDSGFTVGKVLEKKDNSYLVNIGSENVCIEDNHYIENGSLIVIAKENNYLNDGSFYFNKHICLNKDLGIEEDQDEVIIIVEDMIPGSDLFLQIKN